MENFSKRLTELRKEKNLTQQQVADYFKWNLKTYKNYEQGKNFPKMPAFILLAEFFNVSLDYLAGNSDLHTPYTNPCLETLPNHLIQLRRDSGMTKTNIAQHLDITKSGYKRYESGRSIPPLNRLIALADLFGVSLDELVGFDKR